MALAPSLTCLLLDVAQPIPSSPNSWFSSLTRSKGKSGMRTMDTQSQLVPDPPQPEIHEPSTSEMTTTAQPIPQAIPGPLPQPWISSTPPSSPPKEAAPIAIPSTPPPTYPLNLEPVLPHNPSPTPEITERPPVYTASRSDKSTPPSSVDDRVPSLPTTPPAAQLQHTVTFVPLKSPPLGQTTTTGLNPSSSSRFTLSIPLLGRAKVPLGSVLGKEKEKEKGMSCFCF